MRTFGVTTAGFGLLAASYVQGQIVIDNFESECAAAVSQLQLPNTTVYFSQYAPQGVNISIPDNNVTCGGPLSLPAPVDVCRVALYTETSSRSGINWETWLPKNWTGRFSETGNGGLNGCIDYENMGYLLSYGFTTVGTNNGHNGTSGGAFLNNPEVVNDFAFRAIHTGAVVGKQLTQQFYGQCHTKSYYLGCSTGGRQGFKAVQDYPEDFDGVVAGAPAFAFNSLIFQSGQFFLKTGAPNASTFLTTAQWELVRRDVIAQCDRLDGALDGVLENPDLCNYRPERLLCTSSNSTNCLTPAQANTVRLIYEPVFGENGTFVYPGADPASEALASRILYNGRPFDYTQDWFRFAVYNDPSWDPSTLSVRDYTNALAADPGGIQTWKGDLSAFRDAGGKVLTYHGQMDGLITGQNSPRYYDYVSRTMNLTPDKLDEFYRFFTISGMAHCSGGDGAYAIGNEGTSGNWTNEPEGNVLAAMIKWVEEDEAPETITGVRWINGTKENGVDYERRHCKYPARNSFLGGDFRDPDQWECVV